jgi:hypothetical protein
LLCAAKKSRDTDHQRNFVYDEMRGIDHDTLADELRSAPGYVPIPGYAFDRHTRRGNAMGKTKVDFFRTERSSLVPLEQGLFDYFAANKFYQSQSQL